jgi:hypothetical protein
MTSASGASSRGTRAGSETRTPTDRVFAMPCTSRLNEGKPAACSVRCGALCHDPRRRGTGAAASEPGPRPLASSRLKSERRERNKFPNRRRLLQRRELVSRDQISTHAPSHTREKSAASENEMLRSARARAMSCKHEPLQRARAGARTRIDSFDAANRFFAASHRRRALKRGRVTDCVESFPFDSSCRNTSGARSHRANMSPAVPSMRKARMSLTQLRFCVANQGPIDLIGSSLFVFGSCANELSPSEQIGVHLHR